MENAAGENFLAARVNIQKQLSLTISPSSALCQTQIPPAPAKWHPEKANNINGIFCDFADS
jgi:hypothetical protein